MRIGIAVGGKAGYTKRCGNCAYKYEEENEEGVEERPDARWVGVSFKAWLV